MNGIGEMSSLPQRQVLSDMIMMGMVVNGWLPAVVLDFFVLSLLASLFVFWFYLILFVVFLCGKLLCLCVYALDCSSFVTVSILPLLKIFFSSLCPYFPHHIQCFYFPATFGGASMSWLASPGN